MNLQLPAEGKEIGADGLPTKTYITVPITKATSKGEPAWIEVCIDDIPADAYKEILIQGLKTLLNRGMSNVTGAKTEKSRQVAFEIAKENKEKLGSIEKEVQPKIRMSAGVRTKANLGKLHTEAMRIARAIAKDQLRAAGEKVSLITAKTFTLIATKMLESPKGAAILEAAKKNLEEREAEANANADVLEGIKIEYDQTKIAAAAKKGKKPKSEAPAGVVAQGKGQAQHASRH